ncbi:uncharacterized protein LY79DRAFT_353228 [Colletotrichum navitas]|uniref:Uncharacterized protein n=1 Tax=Colletotrichum navitas TaxID=681940 RepID=A0AAD8Q974_9PEZI|nr:uncharacterized protein LY79DRAFT_353228 [Colletotrichum navitas]KAK1597686.1 hypothetical protein LY79DRAFT_353228 [Colletotrichum navitas]
MPIRHPDVLTIKRSLLTQHVAANAEQRQRSKCRPGNMHRLAVRRPSSTRSPTRMQEKVTWPTGSGPTTPPNGAVGGRHPCSTKPQNASVCLSPSTSMPKANVVGQRLLLYECENDNVDVMNGRYVGDLDTTWCDSEHFRARPGRGRHQTSIGTLVHTMTNNEGRSSMRVSSHRHPLTAHAVYIVSPSKTILQATPPSCELKDKRKGKRKRRGKGEKREMKTERAASLVTA